MSIKRLDGINNLIIFAVVLAIGFAAIIGVNRIFMHIFNGLDQKIENKDKEIAIGTYILNHLISIESDIYEISLMKNPEYADIKRREITKEVNHLKMSFHTLNNGGNITHHIELNIVGTENYEEKIYYVPTEEIKYNIEAIDISPKLDETLIKLDQLIILIDAYDAAAESGDVMGQMQKQDEIEKFIKFFKPHFVRMHENASRIIYESKIEADTYHKNIERQKELFYAIEWAVSIGVMITIIFLGYYLGKQFFHMNIKLSKLAYDAEQANIAKTMFLTNMSHEIRTPLNAIIGFSEILASSPTLNDSEKEQADIITRSGNSLLSIVNDVLDLSKIESNSFKLENVSFNTNELFEEIIELYNIKAQEKEIKLDYEADLHVPKFIFGDPVRIKQVLSNLLANAIKFTDQGGIVSLTIKVIQMNDKEVELSFEVADNGIGISKENQKHIFNSFEQAEEGIVRKFGGTGLGLAISKKFVEAMGSHIQLESELGKGSCFRFTTINCIDHSSIAENLTNQWDMRFGVCCKETTCPITRGQIVHYLREYGEIIEDFDQIVYQNLDMIFVFYNYDLIDRLSFIKDNYPVPVVFVGDINLLSQEEKSLINDYISEPLYTSKVTKMLSRYYFNKLEGSEQIVLKKYDGKVLVAEDNGINRQLIEILLKRHDIEAVFANNGEEAVDIYRKEKPELVFMDLHMPIMDGVEATKKIRNMETEKNPITIIALTADALGINKAELDVIGFDEVVTKPIQIDKLVQILDQILTEKQDSSPTQKQDAVSTEKENDTESMKQEPFAQSSILLEEGKPSKRKLETSKDSMGQKESANPIQLLLQEGFTMEEAMLLMDQFYLQLNEHFTDIKSQIEAGNGKLVYQELHRLKGSTANLRFDEGVNMILSMERYALDGELSSIDLNRLEEYFVKLKSRMEQAIYQRTV